MKIFSTNQIKSADVFTIKNEPIKSIDLMERASENCFKWLCENINWENKRFLFFCGTGNNGGDGLAIARMFVQKKADVAIYILNANSKKSEDFLINEKRLPSDSIFILKNLYPDSKLPEITEKDIIIDAVFGSGLNKPVNGFLANVINHINSYSKFTISIDIPSGLFADENSDNNGSIVNAHVTLSLQFPKLSFMFSKYGCYAGNWVIIPIGLHEGFIENEKCSNYFTLKNDIKEIIKSRKKFSHKGNYGHAFLMCGSYGKIGASLLASRACLRSGCGLLTVHLPRCGNDIIQGSFPEAMTISDSNTNHITDCFYTDKYSAVGLGPGIGTNKETMSAIAQLFKRCKKPIVIDADAINIMSERKTLKNLMPKNSIITPHIKEFERFVGTPLEDDNMRFEKQKELSAKHNIYIVLKGAYTCITTPQGNAYFNSTGNPGMATAGSGDVLTGIITGLLCQGFSPLEAARTAVFLHGLAGDLAVKEKSEQALIATDIIDYLPMAFLNILS